MIPKFRAWDKETKQFVEIDVIYFSMELLWIKIVISSSLNHVVNRKFDEVEFMQSTGLLNCETVGGKKVEGWEGDIADIGWSDQAGEFHSDRIVLKKPFEYSIDEARWLNNAEYIVILGNVHENKELMEVSE